MTYILENPFGSIVAGFESRMSHHGSMTSSAGPVLPAIQMDNVIVGTALANVRLKDTGKLYKGDKIQLAAAHGNRRLGDAAGAPVWSPFTSSSQQLAVISAGSVLTATTTNPRAAACDYWDAVNVPQAYGAYHLNVVVAAPHSPPHALVVMALLFKRSVFPGLFEKG